MYQHKDGIFLRKVSEDDLYDLLKLKNESWWGTHNAPILNREDQDEWYKNIPDNQLVMIACEKSGSVTNCDSTVKVGVAIYSEIDHLNRTCNLSGSVFKERRNSVSVKNAFSAGLDFAFEMLNMHRVQAEVLECNLAAQKLEVQHLQFRVEGRRRKSVYKCGVYFDSVMLGILREEWFNTDRVKAYEGSCNEVFNPLEALKRSDKSSRVLGEDSKAPELL